LDNGGLPMGRLTEISGGESTGKTMLATQAMIATQRLGGIAMMLDYEHAFSLKRAVGLGLLITPQHWIYKQPLTAEEGFDFIDKLATRLLEYKVTVPVTIVLDSVASMQTKAELEANYETLSNMRTRLSLAAFMSGGLKKLAKVINDNNITMLFINQLRDKPGVLFGDKEGTPGGRALRFYASTRIKLGKLGKVKDDDGKVIGEMVAAKVVKNKVHEPMGVVEYLASYKEGINLYATHINTLATMGLLGSTKGWCELDGKKYRKSDLEEALRADPYLYDRMLSLFEPQIAPPELEIDETAVEAA
jgi:recombination protein RecA